MNPDWRQFLDSVSWFPGAGSTPGQTAPAMEVLRPGEQFSETFPTLCGVLALADVTPVQQKKETLYLFGWNRRGGGRFGWLSPAPGAGRAPGPLCEDHLLLLGGFGGITERWNEPEDMWLLNLNDALTARAATVPDLPLFDWELSDAADALT